MSNVLILVGGAVEKNRKRKRLHSETLFDETPVGHQNIHSKEVPSMDSFRKQLNMFIFSTLFC